MAFSIVPMTPRHADAMAALELECFSAPWSLSSVRYELNNPNAHYWAAELDGVLIGYAGFQRVLDEGHITNVATAPAYRRLGVAGALLRTLISHAQTLALSFLTLEVRVSNAPALTLYQKHGFAPVGLRPGYYEKPREDALLLTLTFNP